MTLRRTNRKAGVHIGMPKISSRNIKLGEGLRLYEQGRACLSGGEILSRVSNTTNTVQKTKADHLQHGRTYWETRMIDGRRPGKPSDIKLFACLRIIEVCDRFDAIDNVAYMTEETVRQYFKSFCNDIVDMHGHIYLKYWIWIHRSGTKLRREEVSRMFLGTGIFQVVLEKYPSPR